MSTAKGGGEHCCHCCGNTFTYKSSLKRHIREVHGEKMMCSICLRHYSRRSIYSHKCRGAPAGVQVDIGPATSEKAVQFTRDAGVQVDIGPATSEKAVQAHDADMEEYMLDQFVKNVMAGDSCYDPLATVTDTIHDPLATAMDVPTHAQKPEETTQTTQADDSAARS